ncbi:MAG: tyrosine-type recombinase/integrase [Alphaproteobacteria bacterium]|nr:tyrosine-type recombinase/integrase [Alphaproteobacteria bacterium]
MPLKLIPPREGKSPYWSVRGTYLRTYVDRSTKASDRPTAAKVLKLWKEEIERGTFAKPDEPTFLDAAVNYMAETGNERFVQPVVDHFGQQLLSEITQQAIDQAAVKLYPEGTAQTRNRQVHTVVSAILKHAGVDGKLKRPKGWRGSKRTDWLKPDQAFRVFKAAGKIDEEFEIFLTTLCYTGMRLTEALTMMVDQVEMKESFAYVRESKNDDPRGVYLPPVVIAALKRHPRGLDRRGQKVFRFTKCGRLYSLMAAVKKATGPDVSFLTFHIFCHTYATWMRRYAGLDKTGLVATGRWRDEASVARYTHVVASEESQRATLLPVEKPWKRRSSSAKSLTRKAS